jgi:GNAT superfamily N-acetyltransferase
LPREQLGELCEFQKLAYPGDARKSDLRLLDWYFRQNPNQSTGDLPLWVARENGKIVGQLATIPVELKAGTTYTKAIWILEFILLEKYRGQGLGKKLVREAEKQHPTMITLGINEASTRVFQSSGWVALGGIHRYHRLLHAGSASRTAGKNLILREGLNLLSAPLRFTGGKRRSSSAYELRPIESFDASVDELWARASTQWACAVRRGEKFLKWQFEDQPGKKFYVIQVEQGGKLAGYAVLFFRKGRKGGPPPKAAISDIVYDRDNQDEIIDTLLGACLEAAMARKAGSLVTDVLDARIESRLKSHGFWRIKNSPRFMAYSTEFPELLYKPENWFLTRGDSDVSIFEEPNVEEL